MNVSPVTGLLAAVLVSSPTTLRAGLTTWNFSDVGSPFLADSGTAVLEYFDPNATEWGDAATIFAKASSLSLPLLDGNDVDVMAFPACTPDQGYQVTHDFAANGSFETLGLISNYTVVMDVLFPSSSDGQWRSLVQTDVTNSTDGDFFIQNQESGGGGDQWQLPG